MPWFQPTSRLVGVLHLQPLPGAPRPSPGLSSVLDRALRDAEALAEGGAGACIVENLGDAPFAPTVEPHVTAMLAVVAREVRQRFGDQLQVGVNALRNDAEAALGAAAAADAQFVRINVHIGAMVTDQGVIQGRARDTLLYRQRLNPDLGLVTDVLVKHAAPLGDWALEDAARDTWHRGGADVLVVSGSGTGRPTDPDDVRRVRDAVPEATIWLGSGMTPERVDALSPLLDAAIVGTWLHRDGRLDQPLDVDRVRSMASSLG